MRTKKHSLSMVKATDRTTTNLLIEDEGKYLATKDIQPLKGPEKQFKIVYRDLVSSDWQKQFEA